MKRRIKYKDFYNGTNIFENDSFTELLAAQWCYVYNFKASSNKFKDVFKIFAYIMRIFTLKKRKSLVNIEGFFSISLDRANDWGLIFPIVKEYDKLGSKYILYISKICYERHKMEIGQLNNVIILHEETALEWNDRILKWSDLINAKKSCDKIKRTALNFKWTDWVRLFGIVLANISYARGMYQKYLNTCKFMVTLGNWECGYIYQIYGIKHFAMQHGDESDEYIGYDTEFNKANVYMWFTYGKHYSKMYKGYFYAKCHAVGNPVFSGDKHIFNKNSKNIVFFSASHVFLNKATRESCGEKRIEATIKELLNLSEDFPQYEIIIKLHPSESMEIYDKNDAIKNSRIKIVSGEVSSKFVLSDVYMAISWFSTVNLEAIKMGSIAVQLTNGINDGHSQAFSMQVDRISDMYKYILDINLAEDLYKKQSDIADEYMRTNENVAAEAISVINKETEIVTNRKIL